MLTKYGKKLLKFIEESENNFDNKVVLYSYIYENFPDDERSIRVALDYLVEKGYLRISRFGNEPKGVALTELYIRRREFVFEERKEFFFKYVLVPVAVSVATSLITSLIISAVTSVVTSWLLNL